jgi:hypothetical protein
MSSIRGLHLLVPALDEWQRPELSDVRLQSREVVVAHLGVSDGSKPAEEGEISDAIGGDKVRRRAMSAKDWRYEKRLRRTRT